jgi:tryptophan-rich sensory protein
MKMIAAIFGAVLVFVYAIGSGLWVNTGDNWYRSLNSPSWQPPDFIFGIIWPYNFIVLGIASVIISQRASALAIGVYLSCFALSVAFALTWAYQFYRPHNLTLASIALVLTALLTIPMVVVAFRVSTPIALALLPYQAWLITAAALSYSYSRLN